MFEREEQCTDFFCCVERHYVPLKFAFVGSAAYTHDKLALTAGYHAVVGSVPDEVAFLVDALGPSLGEAIMSLEELGPGNGVHAGAFYRAFSQKVRINKTIRLLDYSETLLEVARERLVRACPSLNFETVIFDLEKEGLELTATEGFDENRLILLLGNTIGNVESVIDMLRNIRSGMSKSDFFAFSYSVFDSSASRERYLESYRSDELRTAATQPLVMAGASDELFSFEVEFDEQIPAIVGRARFDEEAYLSCGTKTVRIAEGTKIRCFLSRRFSPEQMIGEVQKAGFSVIEAVINDDRSLGYVICSLGSDP